MLWLCPRPPLHRRQHLAPKDGVHGGLIAFALRFQPREHIGIEARCHLLLDRRVKAAAFGAFPESVARRGIAMVDVVVRSRLIAVIRSRRRSCHLLTFRIAGNLRRCGLLASPYFFSRVVRLIVLGSVAKSSVCRPMPSWSTSEKLRTSIYTGCNGTGNALVYTRAIILIFNPEAPMMSSSRSMQMRNF